MCLCVYTHMCFSLVVLLSVLLCPLRAAVGLQESDLIESKTPYHCFNRPFAITDRNIADGDTQGTRQPLRREHVC